MADTIGGRDEVYGTAAPLSWRITPSRMSNAMA